MAKEKVWLEPVVSFTVRVRFNWILPDAEYMDLYEAIHEEFYNSRLFTPQVVASSGSSKKKKKPFTCFVVFVTDPAASPQQAETAVHHAVRRVFPGKI